MVNGTFEGGMGLWEQEALRVAQREESPMIKSTEPGDGKHTRL
jgi:hypothetical protein